MQGKFRGGEEEMIWGICIGLVIGVLLMNLAVEEEYRENEKLRNTIDNLEDDLDNANSRVKNRDNLIKDLKEEQITLLNNSAELRSKIKELVDLPNQTSSNELHI